MRWVIRRRFTEEHLSMARRFDQNKCSIDELNSISKYTVLYSLCVCVSGGVGGGGGGGCNVIAGFQNSFSRENWQKSVFSKL